MIRPKALAGPNMRLCIITLCAIVACATTAMAEYRFGTVVSLPTAEEIFTKKEYSELEVCDCPPGYELNANKDCLRILDDEPTDRRICDDGTISHRQPGGLDYKKLDGSRYIDIGVCGPTAVANVLCMQCGLCENPISWLALTGLEVGGGAGYPNLLNALNHPILQKEKMNSACPIIEGHRPDGLPAGYKWIYFKKGLHKTGLGGIYWGAALTIDDLERLIAQDSVQTKSASPSALVSWSFNPVIVGLKQGDFNHATTVVKVDTKNKTVTHNTWGEQYVTGWEYFEQLWRNTNYAIIYLLRPAL